MQPEIEKPLIIGLIESGDKDTLEEKLETWLPQELAELCRDLNVTDQAFVFNVIDREQAYQTFEELEFGDQVELINELRYRQDRKSVV